MSDEPKTISTESAEQSIISIMLLTQAAIDDVDLKPEHFSADYLKAIYAECLRQIATGGGFSVETLCAELGDVVTPQELYTIAGCHDHSARPLKRLAKQVIDASRSRQLHALSERIAILAFEKSPVSDRIDRAQAEIAKLVTEEDSDEWVDSYTGAINHLALIEQRERGEITGIDTGLHELNEFLDGGLQRGNLVVIGARPSMGKSAIALSIGLHIAKTLHVGFFSLEMSVSDVMDRQAAILGHVSVSAIKRPEKGLDYNRIVEGIEIAKHLKFRMTDKTGVNILQVRSRARALKRKIGLDVLIVDYIGIMAALDPRMPRTYQIEEISRGLKNLAKELDIVVICLAQINRGVAERASQIPGLSDLRDSGAIEQDADVAGFIHRPIQADPSLPAEFNHYGVMRIAKNRQGRCGDIHLHYTNEETRFGPWHGQIPEKRQSQISNGKGFKNGQ